MFGLTGQLTWSNKYIFESLLKQFHETFEINNKVLKKPIFENSVKPKLNFLSRTLSKVKDKPKHDQRLRLSCENKALLQ